MAVVAILLSPKEDKKEICLFSSKEDKQDISFSLLDFSSKEEETSAKDPQRRRRRREPPSKEKIFSNFIPLSSVNKEKVIASPKKKNIAFSS